MPKIFAQDETEIEFYEVHQLLPQTGENVAKALAVVASHPRLLAQCFVKVGVEEMPSLSFPHAEAQSELSLLFPVTPQSAQGLKQLSLRHCDRLLSIVLWHLFDESWEPDATNATTIFLHTLLEARLKVCASVRLASPLAVAHLHLPKSTPFYVALPTSPLLIDQQGPRGIAGAVHFAVFACSASVISQWQLRLVRISHSRTATNPGPPVGYFGCRCSGTDAGLRFPSAGFFHGRAACRR